MEKEDKKIQKIKDLQNELGYRMEVERAVFDLFSKGKLKEGKRLLDTLDDEKARKLLEDDEL